MGRLQKHKDAIAEGCDAIIQEAREAEATLTEFDTKRDNLLSEIESLQTQEEEAEEKSVQARKNLEDASISLSEKKSEESDVRKRIESLEDAIDQKKNESQSLNSTITSSTNELKELRGNINIFPSEFKGFVDQGGRNIILYTVLALVPLLILVAFTLVLFYGASDLTTIYKKQEGIDVWTMFLTRLPFVAIAVFVIHACYAISKLFIREVIRINQQRLNLSKISIVAKDVSDAAIADLGFTDDEIYEIRTKLKMDLIKSHLKGYIDDTYEYDLEISLWEKFKQKQKEKAEKVDSDQDEQE